MNSCSSDETTANDRITICRLQKGDKSNLTVSLNANRLQLTIATARLQVFFSINLKKDEIPSYLMNKFWLS